MKITILKCKITMILQIRCLSEDEKHNCSMTTTAETNNAVVSKLRRDQKYRLQLAAMTNQGYGKWSKVYIVGKLRLKFPVRLFKHCEV